MTQAASEPPTIDPGPSDLERRLILCEHGDYYVLRTPRGGFELCKYDPSYMYGVVVGHYGPGYEARAEADCRDRAEWDALRKKVA